MRIEQFDLMFGRSDDRRARDRGLIDGGRCPLFEALGYPEMIGDVVYSVRDSLFDRRRATDLRRRGLGFVGPTTVYSLMRAIGRE